MKLLPRDEAGTVDDYEIDCEVVDSVPNNREDGDNEAVDNDGDDNEIEVENLLMSRSRCT